MHQNVTFSAYLNDVGREGAKTVCQQMSARINKNIQITQFIYARPSNIIARQVVDFKVNIVWGCCQAATLNVLPL